MALIKKIINFFFVNLEIRAVDCELLFLKVRLLFNHVEEEPNRSRYYTLIFTCFKLSCRCFSFLNRLVLITLHSESLSTASLTISKNSSMISLIKNKHIFYEMEIVLTLTTCFTIFIIPEVSNTLLLGVSWSITISNLDVLNDLALSFQALFKIEN